MVHDFGVMSAGGWRATRLRLRDGSPDTPPRGAARALLTSALWAPRRALARIPSRAGNPRKWTS